MNRPPAGLPLVHRLAGSWTVLALAFLYLPIVLLVVYSFNRSEMNLVWQGATTRWYVELLNDRILTTAARASLIVAAVTTVASVLLGTAGGWLTHRYRFRLARLPVGGPVLSLIALPIVMPDVIMGISLLILFSVLFQCGNGWCTAHGLGRPLRLGWTTLVLSHVTFCFPFVMVAVRARLAGLDPSLEEAAQDLGATPGRAFISVIVPYLWPAIVSGALMSFTLSMDELIVSSFTHGPDSVTLPIVVFGMAKVGLRPTLNAVSAIFVVITAVLMGVAEFLRRPASTVYRESGKSCRVSPR